MGDTDLGLQSLHIPPRRCEVLGVHLIHLKISLEPQRGRRSCVSRPKRGELSERQASPDGLTVFLVTLRHSLPWHRVTSFLISFFSPLYSAPPAWWFGIPEPAIPRAMLGWHRGVWGFRNRFVLSPCTSLTNTGWKVWWAPLWKGCRAVEWAAQGDKSSFLSSGRYCTYLWGDWSWTFDSETGIIQEN